MSTLSKYIVQLPTKIQKINRIKSFSDHNQCFQKTATHDSLLTTCDFSGVSNKKNQQKDRMLANPKHE